VTVAIAQGLGHHQDDGENSSVLLTARKSAMTRMMARRDRASSGSCAKYRASNPWHSHGHVSPPRAAGRRCTGEDCIHDRRFRRARIVSIRARSGAQIDGLIASGGKVTARGAPRRWDHGPWAAWKLKGRARSNRTMSIHQANRRDDEACRKSRR